MDKNEVFKSIKDNKIIAVIRSQCEKKALLIANAVLTGGINIVEITFTVPNAEHVIGRLVKSDGFEKAIIGAGTVLDLKTTKIAIKNGAQFIVSPSFDFRSSQYCLKKNIPYIPGCMTITEIVTALKSDVKIIKLFPSSSFDPSFIKAIKGPLPDVEIMPTGGISLQNIETWFQSDIIAVGVGGDLIGPAKTDNYKAVTTMAKKYTTKIKELRRN